MATYKDTLATYLKAAENRETDLAAAIGTTQPTINRYRKGRRFPDAATARLIDQATGGAVPFAVWQYEFLNRSGIAA